MANHVSTVLWTLATFTTMVVSQSLPYNPTNILLPQASSRHNDIAYVFLQGAGSDHQLAALNISSVIYPSNFSLETVTADLPFDSSSAFIPSISSVGDISVYTGSCSTSSKSELWTFTPSNTGSNGVGTWAQETTIAAGGATSTTLLGANYLSRAFSFSTLAKANASQTSIYVFGGMCPNASAPGTTWQSAASYSNQMLRLAPSASSASKRPYTLGLTASRSPPIAEAGFTITGLTPTYSNGSAATTQQQTFILLGGHTKTAFINMSQVAIWSLPEESWSFVTVDSPSSSANPNTELAVKSTLTNVDSRSGHSAVLTEDGSKIIVYGGWVGDVGQAADPQLAILSLGTGFGGPGDWKWTIPDNQPSGSGIYGHGAVMLPGNIMMVLGGHNISSTSNSKRATTGAHVMFFNATSLTWAPSYTNPAYVAAIQEKASQAAKASSSSSSAKKIGLGVGLSLALLVIIGALLIYFCRSRRMKRKMKESREKDLRNLSLGAADFYHSPSRETGQRRGGFPWQNRGWNGSNDDYDAVYDSNSAVAGYESVHSGAHDFRGETVPTPPRQIPRKPLHSRTARGIYQPTPTFDGSHGRASNLGIAGPIHPIYEADEDGDHIHSAVGGAGAALDDFSTPPGTSESKRYSDPFKDPHPAVFSTPLSTPNRHKRSNSNGGESPAESREREIQEWVADWAAADILLNQQARSHSTAGRVSPTRRAQIIAASTVSSVSVDEDGGRTASNLSERSLAISAVSISRSGSSSQSPERSRSNSLRGFITGMNPFNSAAQSTTGASTHLSPVFDGPALQGPRSLHPSPPKSAGSGSGQSANSFNTANTSFHALQAEAETLLPRPGGDSSSREQSPIRLNADCPGSPSKSKPSGIGIGRGAQSRGWFGSLRKAFIGGDSDLPTYSPSPDVISMVNAEAGPIQESYHGTGLQPPRRAVSAGATLWRRKQGKLDWEDSIVVPSPGLAAKGSSHHGGEPSSPGYSVGDEDEDEWDIERAVENRVVQVMFTVPKEKLRVVNHDVQTDEGSEGGSLRSKNDSLDIKKRKSLGDLILAANQTDGKAALTEPLLEEPELEKEEIGNRKLKEADVERSPSPRRKANTKVLEMVDKMEGRITGGN